MIDIRRASTPKMDAGARNRYDLSQESRTINGSNRALITFGVKAHEYSINNEESVLPINTKYAL